MSIEEIKELITQYIEEPIINFEIEKLIFSDKNGRVIFNNIIKYNVKTKFGVYVWVNKVTREVVYIGLAG